MFGNKSYTLVTASAIIECNIIYIYSSLFTLQKRVVQMLDKDKLKVQML